MKKIDWQFIENNLLFIYHEVLKQDMNKYNKIGVATWQKTMDQIYEFIDLAGEYGLAYEFLIWQIDNLPYTLSGKASIKLLELGLIFKYKTEDDKDKVFDFREKHEVEKVSWEFIENNLLYIYHELKVQDTSKYDQEKFLSWNDAMEQIFEFIDLAGEYGLAYEYISGYLESYPCFISGRASVKLLELGLIFKYKSELEEDKIFDFRE